MESDIDYAATPAVVSRARFFSASDEATWQELVDPRGRWLSATLVQSEDEECFVALRRGSLDAEIPSDSGIGITTSMERHRVRVVG